MNHWEKSPGKRRTHVSLLTACACLLLAAAMSLAGTSCAVRITAAELTAGYERTSPVSGIPPSQAWTNAVNGFAVSLLRASDAQATPEAGGNLALCPLSAACVLGLTADGADGDTLAQLEAALGQSAAAMGTGLRAWNDSLPHDLAVRLGMANAVWFKEGLTVRPAFLQAAVNDYAASCFSAPFDRQTVKDVNNWVSRETGGLIDSLLDPGRLPSDSKMFLVNTVGFDAAWPEENKYQPKDVKSGTFTNADGTERTVTMLHSSETTFLSGGGLSGFVRPYEGGRFALVGLLPDDPDPTAAHGLDSTLSALDGALWTELWTARESVPVIVSFPAFRQSAQPDLKGALTRMGVVDLFDRAACDLSSMTDGGSDLFCADILQKTVIEVDSRGTKAASASAGIFAPRQASPVEAVTRRLTFNRPFLYLIVDTQTGLILFCGIVRSL